MSKEIEQSRIHLYILLTAAKAPIDGSGVMEKLRDCGFTASLASTQRIREFETKGYLISDRTHNGRSGGRCTITKAGRLRIRDAKAKIRTMIEAFG